jgi:hypothetical protein
MARSSTTSDVFNAIAEGRPREVLDVLIAGEKAVGEIVNDLSMSQPQVSKRVEFPNDLEIVLTREFDAPIQLVFDVLTKPEHVARWFAPFDEKMEVCSIDLQVGGDYHIVFVTNDGIECSFRGMAKLTQRMAFRDQAGRDHMNKTDGFEASYDNVEDLLRSLLDPEGRSLRSWDSSQP